MSDQVFWFATRSAGIVCWFAASASIMVGLLIPTRVLGRRPTIPWLLDLHRFFGAMSVLFLVVHMATLWADEFVSFSLTELLVPFVADVDGLSRWSLALGVLAAWFLFAIEGSSLIKNRLTPRAWHTVHLTSFGVMISGAIHGLSAGSDTDNRYLVSATASVTMAIVILAVMRMSRSLGDRKQRYDEEFGYEDEDEGHGRFDGHHDDYDHGYDFEVGDGDRDFWPTEQFDEDAYRYGRSQLADIPVTSGARLLAGQDELHLIDDDEGDDPPWLRPQPHR